MYMTRVSTVYQQETLNFYFFTKLFKIISPSVVFFTEQVENVLYYPQQLPCCTMDKTFRICNVSVATSLNLKFKPSLY